MEKMHLQKHKINVCKMQADIFSKTEEFEA